MSPREIVDEQSAIAFIEDRGMTLAAVLEFKETGSNKQLAKLLHTGPNVVQKLLALIGVTYSGDGATRSRMSVIKNRLKAKTAEDRKLLLAKYPDAASIRPILLRRKRLEAAKEMGASRSDLDWLADQLGLELPSPNTVRRTTYDSRWAELVGPIIDEALGSSHPFSRGELVRLAKSATRRFPELDSRRVVASFTRYMKATHPHYMYASMAASAADKSYVDSLLSRFDSRDLRFLLAGTRMDDAIFISVVGFHPCAEAVRIVRRMLHLSVPDHGSRPRQTTWDWCLSNRSFVLDYAHLPRESKQRSALMARVNRLKADSDAMRTLQNQCLEEMLNLSEIITSSDDPFATAWVMLDMSLSLSDRVRRSFRLYLRWLEGAGVPLVVTENRSTVLPMLKEWGADHAGLLSVADVVRLTPEWFFFQIESDRQLKRRLVRELGLQTIYALLDSLPMLRRNSVYYDYELSGELAARRLSPDAGCLQRNHPEVMSAIRRLIGDRSAVDAVDVKRLIKRERLSPSIAGRCLKALGVETVRNYRTSVFETDVRALLEGLGLHVLCNQRILKPIDGSRGLREIDFYVPDLDFGVEVSPTFTHNSTYGWFFQADAARAVGYQHDKVLRARRQGIQLVTLYERDLSSPLWEDVTVPMLIDRLTGANAVSLDPMEIDVDGIGRDEAMEFLGIYHRDAGRSNSPSFLSYRHRPSGVLLGVAGLTAMSSDRWRLDALAMLPGLDFDGENPYTLLREHMEDQHRQLVVSTRNDEALDDVLMRSGFDCIGEVPHVLTYVDPRDPYVWAMGHELGEEAAMEAGYVEVYDGGRRLWS